MQSFISCSLLLLKNCQLVFPPSLSSIIFLVPQLVKAADRGDAALIFREVSSVYGFKIKYILEAEKNTPVKSKELMLHGCSSFLLL